KAERDDVVARRRHAGHHHALADPHILVDPDMAAEEGSVTDRDMAAEHHIVGEIHIVAELAIVADVRADHDEAAVADPGDAAAVFGAGIHGAALAQVAMRADDQPGRPAAIMHR